MENWLIKKAMEDAISFQRTCLEEDRKQLHKLKVQARYRRELIKKLQAEFWKADERWKAGERLFPRAA